MALQSFIQFTVLSTWFTYIYMQYSNSTIALDSSVLYIQNISFSSGELKQSLYELLKANVPQNGIDI